MDSTPPTAKLVRGRKRSRNHLLRALGGTAAQPKSSFSPTSGLRYTASLIFTTEFYFSSL